MKTLLSTLLSLLILLSSSNLTYSQHFCGGNEVDSEVAIGHKDLSCGMAMTENGCCDNEFTKVEFDDDFSPSSFVFKIDNKHFVYVYQNIYELDLVDLPITVNEDHIYYRPPPLEKDLNILFQRFLI